MQVKVNTKSNYKCLNGQWLNVKEAISTRVSCTIVENGIELTVDFSLKEVSEIKFNHPTLN